MLLRSDFEDFDLLRESLEKREELRLRLEELFLCLWFFLQRDSRLLEPENEDDEMLDLEDSVSEWAGGMDKPEKTVASDTIWKDKVLDDCWVTVTRAKE